jgi:hypothetical protein
VCTCDVASLLVVGSYRALVQVMMYSLNLYIGYHVFRVSDAGGSMIIHSTSPRHGYIMPLAVLAYAGTVATSGLLTASLAIADPICDALRSFPSCAQPSAHTSVSASRTRWRTLGVDRTRSRCVQ